MKCLKQPDSYRGLLLAQVPFALFIFGRCFEQLAHHRPGWAEQTADGGGHSCDFVASKKNANTGPGFFCFLAFLGRCRRRKLTEQAQTCHLGRRDNLTVLRLLRWRWRCGPGSSKRPAAGGHCRRRR